MTNTQRKYINDIEKNLNVKFTAENTRRAADEFIRKYKQANREFNQTHNKLQRPTKKQLILISKIEKALDIKFTGRSFKSAYKFISDNLPDFKGEDNENLAENWCKRMANRIDQKQRQRRSN